MYDPCRGSTILHHQLFYFHVGPRPAPDPRRTPSCVKSLTKEALNFRRIRPLPFIQELQFEVDLLLNLRERSPSLLLHSQRKWRGESQSISPWRPHDIIEMAKPLPPMQRQLNDLLLRKVESYSRPLLDMLSV